MLARFFGPELRAWHGRRPLGIVFWLYGVAASCLFAVWHAAALARGQVALQQLLLLLSALYTVWILGAIWRCAANAVPFWGALARWLTVAWAFNTTLVLLFLQLELIVRLVRG